MQFTIEIDIQGIVAKATSHERIQPLLDKAITEALRQSIDEATGYRSEFRKALTDQFSGSMPHGLEIDDVAKFQQVVNAIISNAVEGANSATIKTAIEQSMKAAIPDVPSVVKLSAFVETIRCGLSKEDHESFFMQLEETEYGSRWLSFDSNERASGYAAKYRLGLNEAGEVFSLKLDGEVIKRASLPDVISSMEGMLLAMYTGRTRLEVDMDPDDVEDAARSKTDY